MDTRKRIATTEMQVTSIRLETELKERLRELSGSLGYQALIREILWQFVEQQTTAPERSPNSLSPWPSGRLEVPRSSLSSADIRATFAATAQREEQCAITGQIIQPQQSMWLGLTVDGDLVPLSTGLQV